MITRPFYIGVRWLVNSKVMLLVTPIVLAAMLASCGTQPAHTGPPIEPTSSDHNGKIAFVVWTNHPRTIFVMNPDGTGVRKLPTKPSADTDPAWSPDGMKLAFRASQDGNPDIYVMNADGSGLKRITTKPTDDREPSWSPDGKRIAFARGAADNGGVGDIYTIKVDGTGLRQLTDNDKLEGDPDWSPDGKSIVFWRAGLVHGSYIYTMSPDGTHETNLSDTAGAEGSDPYWSPDGKKIAFACGEGDWQEGDICTMDADGTERTNLTESLSELAQAPAYSPNGVKIVFESMYEYGQFQVYKMDADGTDIHTVEKDPPNYEVSPDWQPIPTEPLANAARYAAVKE